MPLLALRSLYEEQAAPQAPPRGAGIGRWFVERHKEYLKQFQPKPKAFIVSVAGVAANSRVGHVNVNTEIDITDDELMAILAVASSPPKIPEGTRFDLEFSFRSGAWIATARGN